MNYVIQHSELELSSDDEGFENGLGFYCVEHGTYLVITL